jgi:hypothetical protein
MYHRTIPDSTENIPDFTENIFGLRRNYFVLSWNFSLFHKSSHIVSDNTKIFSSILIP